MAILGQSCVGHKDMVYLEENKIALPEEIISESPSSQTRLFNFQEYKIQPYDQLMIRINAFDGSTEDYINREFAFGSENSQVNYDPASIYFNSYSVNDSGIIYLPLLEKVKVGGLTLVEAKMMLDEAYKPYLKYASSNVKLANGRVSVLGEVVSPGVYYLYNDQSTILDALSMAGDFTDFSNRKKVKLIRRTKEEVTIVYLNLGRSDFVTSKYFYIQPNDLIYVEPVKPKAFDISSRSLGTVISGVSLLVLIANLFVK